MGREMKEVERLVTSGRSTRIEELLCWQGRSTGRV